MKRDNRQILVNPHSSQEKIPVGALNLGEIAVQHNNVEDAALYVETVGDSESASTIAKFITEKAIDSKIENALDIVEMQIDSLNEEIGLPHDPEAWNSGLSVWQAIEQTYEEMTAGTAAASTKMFIDEADGHNEEYLKLRSVLDEASSAVNYYIKSEGITEAIDSAWLSAHTEIETLSGVVKELSAATEDVLGALDYAGVAQEGKPVVNVTQNDGLVSAETGRINTEFIDYDSANTLDEVIESIIENIEANKIESEDGSIVVTPGADGTTIKVNRDDATIVLNDNNELVADLKLSAITPSSVNVREEFALIDHNGRQLGDTVKVYKDSSLHHAELGTMGDELVSEDEPTVIPGTGDTALDLIYHKEDGTYELVKIDINDFLEESEFQDGLVVDNHVVKIKVNENSEKVVVGSGETAPVLSVGPDGIKVDNIQKAIDYAVADLAGSIDADVLGTSSDGHVAVEVVQEDTKLTQVVVSTDDIASEKELDKVEEAVGLNEDGSFSADPTSNFASAATSVRDEIKLIDQALKEISDELNGVSVDEGSSVENFVSLTVSNDGNGATAITIDDTELKETIDFINDDIATEIVARENADAELRAELLGTSASTSGETSIWGVKNYVDEIVNDLDADAVQAVEFAAVAEKDETDYGSNAGATVVPMGEGEVGKKLILDLSLLKLDCGEY
jgi:hypothetical protein